MNTRASSWLWAEPESEVQSPDPDEILPNGYRRGAYHEVGFTDRDIEFYALDSPLAPPPYCAWEALIEAYEMLDRGWLRG